MGGGQSKTIYTPISVVGQTIIITGGNSGIGYHAAYDLMKKGANVTITSRNEERGNAAVTKMKEELATELKDTEWKGEEGTEDGKKAPAPGTIEMELLDLCRLNSVSDFAKRWGERKNTQIDILINNAGIMMPPKREVTEDGFESQLQTNHLGHFALTQKLFGFIFDGRAEASITPRIINVSSIKAASGKVAGEVDFKKTDDSYNADGVYSESKLANLLFTHEMSKRYPTGMLALTCHPGVSDTGLFKHAFGSFTWAFQKATMGALPLIRAATDAAAVTDDYFGPTGLGGSRGEPERDITKPKLALDDDLTARYWLKSEEATGVKYASKL